VVILRHSTPCGGRFTEAFGVRSYFLAMEAALSAYFFWKRSTRPAVSISFCLPVKKDGSWSKFRRESSVLDGRAGLKTCCRRRSDLHGMVIGMDSFFHEKLLSAAGLREQEATAYIRVARRAGSTKYTENHIRAYARDSS